MDEQLELFGDQDVTPLDEQGASPGEPTENPGKQEEDGTIMVWVGLDDELTERVARLCGDLGLERLSKDVRVVWNKRLRSAAGRAKSQLELIELNVRLQILPEPAKTDETNRTLLHELAHLVAFERNRPRRIQPHGREWKQACADLGIPGEARCHDLDFQPRRMKRKYLYECPVCSSAIPRVRRIKRPVACHSCCRKHNGGKFDPRFILVEKRLIPS